MNAHNRPMRRWLGWLAACAVCLGGQPAHAAPTAQAILDACDTIRNPNTSFSFTNSLTEYRDGTTSSSSTLTVYARRDPASGQYHSLVRFEAPARDTGKLMLFNDRDLWFYDRASKVSVRLSPQQRLLGQASNGDTVAVNLARDYHPELLGEEDVADGDRQTRHSYKLALSAARPEATYHHIEMWIDAQTSQPVKSRFFAESGRLLKTAYYRGIRTELGQARPTETVIIDGLNPKWVTVMRYSNYAARTIPETWMQRDFLPNFKPDTEVHDAH